MCERSNAFGFDAAGSSSAISTFATGSVVRLYVVTTEALSALLAGSAVRSGS